MENYEKNLKKENINYARKKLIDIGFLKENEHFYSENEILALIEYLREIKEEVENPLQKIQKGKKRKNHFLFDDLINKTFFESNIEIFKNLIFKKSKVAYGSINYNRFLNFYNKNFSEMCTFLKHIIRVNRAYPNISEISSKYDQTNYKGKMEQILNYIENSCENLSKTSSAIKLIVTLNDNLDDIFLNEIYDFSFVKFFFCSLKRNINS